jgi:hypothetical protein
MYETMMRRTDRYDMPGDGRPKHVDEWGRLKVDAVSQNGIQSNSSIAVDSIS